MLVSKASKLLVLNVDVGAVVALIVLVFTFSATYFYI